MADLTLVIGNKAYSSWSLRAWLALRLTAADFEEIVIPLRRPDTRSEILKYSPSGKVPALIDGETTVWESLAIIEYLAEKFPDAGLWPEDPRTRAEARAIAAEVHAGFGALRRAMPMNIRRRIPGRKFDDKVQEDLNRIQAIWRETRRRHAGDDAFLFGAFSAADAMFAPVASRFATYEPALGKNATAYVGAVMAHPLVAEWAEGAEREPWIISEFEPEDEGG